MLMTEREKKLQRTVEWLINLLEDAVNKTDDYCKEKCPVRDHDRNCPAELLTEYISGDGEDIELGWERDYQDCMELQVEWYMEKANERFKD